MSLILLLIVVGLLIAPGHFHRIAEHGEDTERANAIINFFGTKALLPFELSLGLSLFCALQLGLGMRPGAIVAAVFTLVALFCWYGLGGLAKASTGRKERTMKHVQKKTPLDKKIEQLLTEASSCRGVQALLGFQLVVFFTKAFAELPLTMQLVHAAALGFIALAIILLMTPAAYHRIVYAGEDTPAFYRLGNRFVSAATLPLALGLSGDFMVPWNS